MLHMLGGCLVTLTCHWMLGIDYFNLLQVIKAMITACSLQERTHRILATRHLLDADQCRDYDLLLILPYSSQNCLVRCLLSLYSLPSCLVVADTAISSLFQ
jgi:hypothetical protein